MYCQIIVFIIYDNKQLLSLFIMCIFRLLLPVQNSENEQEEGNLAGSIVLH